MNNFDKTIQIFKEFSANHNIAFPEEMVSDLIKTSYDSNEDVSLYTNTANNLNVLDMDVFAKDIYYHIYGQHKKDNILNSPDAFLINDENHWFFIEFKNSPITSKTSTLKNNIIKKAFCVIYSMIDVLVETRQEEMLSSYANPLNFFRNNVTYILVCDNNKNPNVAQRNVDNRAITGEYRFTPEFMQKLSSYLFCGAYVYTEEYFEKEFVKRFKY